MGLTLEYYGDSFQNGHSLKCSTDWWHAYTFFETFEGLLCSEVRTSVLSEEIQSGDRVHSQMYDGASTWVLQQFAIPEYQ